MCSIAIFFLLLGAFPGIADHQRIGAIRAQINGGTIGPLTIINAPAGSTISGTTLNLTPGGNATISKIRPPSDSTTAIQVQNAAGSSTLMDFDTSNLRVGIGTTSPSAKLTVSSGGSGGLQVLGNGGYAIDWGDSSANMGRLTYESTKALVYSQASNDLGFGSAQYGTHMFLKAVTGNLGLGTTDGFGTSAAKVLSIAEGTAPTTSPADVSQLWSANQNGAGTNALYYRNESGQSGVVAHQAPLVNLLTNSGFGVWSQGTVTATATGAAPVTDGDNAALTAGGTLVTNGGVDSDTASWSESGATLASVAGGKTGNCLEMTWVAGAESGAYQSISSGLTSGKLYQLSAYVKSGTAGAVSFSISVGNSGTQTVTGTTSGSWVRYTYMWEYPGSGDTTIRLYQKSSAAGTTLFDSITLHEITPGCIAADTVGPDGWWKYNTGAKVWREHTGTNTKYGSFYALKMLSDASNDGLIWPSSALRTDPHHLERFRNRQTTFGAWVKTSTASNARLGFYDGSTTTYSGYHSGGGSWEWLEVTYTFPTNSTYANVSLFQTQTTSTAYFSQPMLVFGPSIGQGNYSAPPGEIVWTDTTIVLTSLDGVAGFSDVSATTLNLEADSSGRIPKGAKATYVISSINDSLSSASNAYLYLSADATQGYQYWTTCAGVPDDRPSRAMGWQRCDSNGDWRYTIDASGSATFDITLMRILGVQVN
jgi:hypothetical protein